MEEAPMETDGKTTNPTRRMFATQAAALAAGWILTACGPKRLYEAPRAQLKKAIEDLERQYRERLGVNVSVSDAPPIPGVEFAYALNISRCIGCRRCVHACVAENNQSRSPEIQYIRVLKMEKGSIDLETSDHHYDLPLVPENDSFFMPVQCHQCAKPPCVKVCPVEATWKEKDG